MSHGGNIRQLREKIGDGVHLLDFSASINPLGFPSWLRAEVSRNLTETAHYPDIEAKEFITTASRIYNVSTTEITPANGTTEFIFALPHIFKFKKAVIPEPCYTDYRHACEKEGMSVLSHPLTLEDNFRPNIQELEKILPDDECLVFLAHPNNPTGQLLDVSTTLGLIRNHPRSVFIIDEAYLDFTQDTLNGSFIQYISQYPNLIVLRSLTKFYALAGLRLGIAFADSELTTRLQAALPPWTVNTLAQKIGTRAIQDHEFQQRSLSAIADFRQSLLTLLQKIKGLQVFTTTANFILCRLHNGMSASELSNALLPKGIAIRVCSDFKNLDQSYFRVAVKNDHDNQTLFTELQSAIDHTPITDHSLRPKKTPSLMFLGCSSNAGKSIIVSALCRILLQDGLNVAPFKSQNMALNSFVTPDGLEMGRAQAVQAQAARLEADIRMNPVLLKPNTDTGSQVIIMGKPVGNMRVKEYIEYKDTAFKQAQKAYDSLAAEYDAIILEGAGSPGEVNLKSHDIVNTRMAEYACASSILVGDIDRGGVYASLIGMYETFEEWEREQVQGFLINKFRGDPSLLHPAHQYVADFTGREVIGVVPYLQGLGLPEEDSVSFAESFSTTSAKDPSPLDIALITFPHISNFTDFAALTNEPDVNIRPVRTSHDLGNPDCILLPGSKNVIGDLDFLQKSGLSAAIAGKAGNTVIVGVCGGFQILGNAISDPLNIEGGGETTGLGLLQVTTTLAKDKTLSRTRARHLKSGKVVTGYEIHHGKTELQNEEILFRSDKGDIVGAGSQMIWGTYLHGVFDTDDFRRYFINTIHQTRGHTLPDTIRYHYDLEPAFDRLAQTVRKNIDMDFIYRLLGL